MGASPSSAYHAIISLLEGGFIPNPVPHLSYYYKGIELLIRVAIFWTVAFGF